MAEFDTQLQEAFKSLRESKERKFDETADLVINLQKFEVKRNQVNLATTVPHKIKEKKICAFLEARNPNVDCVIKEEFSKYKDKKLVKQLVDKYDFFIAQASVMPLVASTFGRVLGPVGKMPSPQLGLLINADDKAIQEIKEKINNSIKIKTKECSIKVPIGKRSMKDEDIIENINSLYHAILKELPRDKENIKNIEVKFTMSKPIKIKIR